MTHFAQLSDMKIKSLKPSAKAYKAFDGQGLYLEVMPNGSKKWRYRYLYQGQDKRITLGTYPTMGLKEARTKAEDERRLLAESKDPLQERHIVSQEASELTFLEVAREWEKQFFANWRAATVKKKRIQLNGHIYSIIGDLPIKQITPVLILEKVLRPIQTKGQLETAHRAKMLCSQIFRFAVATGQADRDPTQDLRGAMPTPKVKHHATIIEPVKLVKLLNDIQNYNGHVIVRYALRLLPLVFVRPGELRHAEWSEIDWPDAQWRIPAEKMKMRLPHLVPLSRQAVDILKSLFPFTGGHKFVFPGQRGHDRPMSDAAVNAALRYLGYSGEEITGHGFRSMASTILNEKGYNRDWIERQLAHTERDNVRAAYNYAEYLPERRRMMQEWADYLDSLRENC
ncbi:integrase [Deltaproteobacteria bacterium]|nr:integrase [Deltaproteobacteria bacterium]